MAMGRRGFLGSVLSGAVIAAPLAMASPGKEVMLDIKTYYCPECGNALYSDRRAGTMCCGNLERCSRGKTWYKIPIEEVEVEEI